MKNAFVFGGRIQALLCTLLLMVFASACSKHADDCPAPDPAPEGVTTRVFDHGSNAYDSDIARPEPGGFRGAEVGQGGSHDDTISDDGDDEADGEGNKKVRDMN